MNSIPENIKEEFQEQMLAWWKDNKDTFPWRKTKNPYHILLAEILLRKTTRIQVESVYEELIEKCPTPAILSNYKEKELKSMISSLGMENNRVKILKITSKTIEKEFGGIVPDNADDLMSLMGVGRYSANAVLCFAYGHDQSVIDTNTARVIQRVFGYISNKARPRDDQKLWEMATEIIPTGKAREFNYALLDLGGKICKQSKPLCQECPLIDICTFYLETNNDKKRFNEANEYSD